MRVRMRTWQRELGGVVRHGVDARQLHVSRALDDVPRVDAICFNFPHEGRGVKDEAVSVRRHQQLLRQFLQVRPLDSQCGALCAMRVR